MWQFLKNSQKKNVSPKSWFRFVHTDRQQVSHELSKNSLGTSFLKRETLSYTTVSYSHFVWKKIVSGRDFLKNAQKKMSAPRVGSSLCTLTGSRLAMNLVKIASVLASSRGKPYFMTLHHMAILYDKRQIAPKNFEGSKAYNASL